MCCFLIFSDVLKPNQNIKFCATCNHPYRKWKHHITTKMHKDGNEAATRKFPSHVVTSKKCNMCNVVVKKGWVEHTFVCAAKFFPCDKCSKRYDTEKKLNRHKRIKHVAVVTQ